MGGAVVAVGLVGSNACVIGGVTGIGGNNACIMGDAIGVVGGPLGSYGAVDGNPQQIALVAAVGHLRTTTQQFHDLAQVLGNRWRHYHFPFCEWGQLRQS